MKKALLLILPLLAITFNSCSKDDEGGKNPKSKLLKSYQWDGGVEGSGKATFSYDNNSKVIKQAWTSEGDTETTTISYATNRITVISPDGVEEYMLDNNEYITSNTYDNTPEATYTYTNGLLSTETYSGFTFSYTWLGENLIETTDNTGRTITHTYNTTENKLNIGLGYALDEGALSSWCGKLKCKGMASKNYLVKEETNDGYSCNYTYTFDSEGYPTKITMTYADGYTEIYLLEYQ